MSTLGVAITALVLIGPYSINNLIHGRYPLGVGSALIVVILVINGWAILRGRHYPMLSVVGFVPAIIIFLAYSITEQGMVSILWCYPTVIAFCFMLPERAAWFAAAVLYAMVSYLVADVVEPAVATGALVTLLAVGVFAAIFVRVLTIQQRNLETLATVDPLTGLANRTLLASSLERATEQSQRTQAGLTVIALDIDHFKSINDRFGHDAGDVALHGIGELLLKRVRRSDYTFRLGGEEFLVVLCNTGLKDGLGVAEELRETIESALLVPDHQVTASLGVATLQTGEDWASLVKRSDENLYSAKSAGRNQVVG